MIQYNWAAGNSIPGGRRECMLIPGVMYLYQKIRFSNDNASFFDVYEVF